MIIVLALLSGATGLGQGVRPGARVLRKRPAAYVRPVATAIRLADSVMDSGSREGNGRAARWTYEESLVWLGMMRLWYSTGDGRYFNYVRQRVDGLIDKEGDGRLLLSLYEVTLQEKYYKAAMRLRQQLKGWEDGVYIALPFDAQYAALFHEDSIFDDITRQFAAIERHAGDSSAGRTMGWYGMALVDALDYFPAHYSGRDTLLAMLQRYAAAVRNGQVPGASASAMFVYTLARGVREGYLPASYRSIAERGYRGLVSKYIRTSVDSVNDPKGIGAFLLAAVATDELYTSFGAKEKTVLLDYYFNNERRKDITGRSVRWHYTWEDKANSGFSILGQLFRQYGAHTDSLPVAPTADNLKHAGIYIIVDPDDEREVPSPHYPGPAEIGAIADWVKAGGVLVLMSNDSANAEFAHFNVLAGTFGIQFNYDDYHKVTGNNYSMGAFTMPVKDGIFKTTKKIYIKELSTLQLNPPARPYYSDSGHVIMAIARVGKGTVFAVGDPWFYNEYTDGRKLPADYENYNAARDWVQWLLLQAD